MTEIWQRVFPPKQPSPANTDACPDCGGVIVWGIVPCPDGNDTCLVAHYGYRCSACGVVWRKTTIEAGSITIGDKDGLHVIIDSNGQRIRNGEEQLWP